MSQVHLTRVHDLGRREATARIERFLEDLKQEYEFEGIWEDDVLHLKRSGAKGEVLILDDRVEVQIKLGVLLKPLRHKIEHRLAEELDMLFPT